MKNISYINITVYIGIYGPLQFFDTVGWKTFPNQVSGM